MSDHEFEKQVRQKLDSLKLSPPADAWVNIEEKLRGSKSRRVPFIWTSLLLVGMTAVGYLIFNTDNKASKNNLTVAEKTDLVKKESGVEQQIGTEQQTGTEKNILEGLNAPEEVLPAQDVNSKKQGHDTTAAFATAGVQKKNLLKSARNNNNLKRQGVNRNPSTDSGKDIEEKDVQSEEIPDSESHTAANSKVNQADKHDIKKQPVKLIPSSQDSTQAAVSKPPAKKIKNSKWSFAVNASSGIVMVNESGLFNFNKPKVEDVASTADFPAVTYTYAPLYKPSTISPGLAFSAGLETKRELSERFSISAGLNYAQFNTESKVGQRVNASQIVNNGVRGYLYVQNYYLQDASENMKYRNRYHFIEVPVTLHTRLNKGDKLPVYWDAGVVVSRLLSSTSLHFDGTTGVYYKNDRLLNQTQVGVATGFSFALFNKSAHPLWIGPSARSNISTILKKDVSSSKHFVSLGLNLKLFLKR